MQVIADGKGELVVLRRPEKKVKAYKYLPCLYCFAMVRRNAYTAHGNDCKLKPSERVQGNSAHSALMLLAPYLVENEKKSMDIILQGMKEKETSKNTGMKN